MPRLPRVYIEGILYYIVARSGHTYNLFLDNNDYKEYVSLIAKYKEQYGFKLFSYCLLPTHLHMLIEVKNNIGVSNIMHDINSLYTKGFNSKYNKKGHLFQERFKAVLAEKETYLLPLARHTYLNPVRLKLAEDPRNYPYSSLRQFFDLAQRAYPNMQDEVEEVFKQLSGREKEFESYVSAASPKELNDFKLTLHRKRILGSPEFVERINKIIQESARAKEEAGPKRKTRIYIFAQGTAILVLVVVIGYLQHRAARLKSEYQNYVSLYQDTLSTLKRQQKEAVSADKPAGDYEWKIRLTESALRELREINGYSWNIELTQVSGPAINFSRKDALAFDNYQVSSSSLAKEGFVPSNYSRTKTKDGLIWETIQFSDTGLSASWRGEWDGKVMAGVLSKKFPDSSVKDFSFVSVGERNAIAKEEAMK